MVAVTIPPTAVGRITVSTVRVLEAPKAMLPSRRVDGTSSSTSSVARAISGSMMIESPSAPAKPLWPRPTTIRLKMNTPITMVGTPASTFSVSRIASASRCGANSVLKIASSTPIGSEIAAAIRTMITVPTIAFSMPPPDWPNGAAFWVKRSRFTRGKAFLRDRDQYDREHGHREQRSSGRQALHDLPGQLAATSARCLSGQADVSRGAHGAPSLRRIRRTIRLAIRLVIRLITSRMTARYASEAFCKAVAAPEYWAASRPAMVSAGA